MAFQHPAFRRWLCAGSTAQRVLAVLVDEAHCITQWGGDFRVAYGRLDKLRSFVPPDAPFLATSATLTPGALGEVCKKLEIRLSESFFLNLGNYRHNITMSVKRMKNAKDYDAVNEFLPSPDTVTTPDDFPKTIIYADSINATQRILRHLRRRFGKFSHLFAGFFSHRSKRSKRKVMKKFREGKIKVLCATEAAGMVGFRGLC